MAPPAEVDTSWFLDGASGTIIAPFRSKFPDHLRNKDPAHIRFLLDGTATNNKGQVQAYKNEAHAILRMHGLLGSKTEAQAFADPFPTTGPTLAQCSLAVTHAEALPQAARGDRHRQILR